MSLQQARLYHPTVLNKETVVSVSEDLNARLGAAFASVPGNTWAEKVQSLNGCPCCPRHNARPKVFGPPIQMPSRKHLRDDSDTIKQCPCNCRHMTRQICRQFGVALPPLTLPEVPRTPAEQAAVETEYTMSIGAHNMDCAETDNGWYQPPKPWEAGYKPTKRARPLIAGGDRTKYTKEHFIQFFGNLDLWYELGYDHEITTSASALTGGCHECNGFGDDRPGCATCGRWNAAAHAERLAEDIPVPLSRL